jgi:glycosyltransferase involved in cell wall biosynthesis
VLTIHGIEHLEQQHRKGALNRVYRSWLTRRAEVRAIGGADRIISINPFVTEVFEHAIRAPVEAIPNPVAGKFFDARRDLVTAGRVLFVGRLIPRKGVDLLVRAFADVASHVPTAELHLVGPVAKGPEGEAYARTLRALVEAWGLSGRVHFRGTVSRSGLPDELARAQLVVLPSRLDTAAMCVLEAQAAGKPVIVTAAGGNRHLIRHGVDGLMVPPENPVALAESIGSLLVDPGRCEEMGRAGVINARRTRADAVVERTLEVYESVLGARGFHPR